MMPCYNGADTLPLALASLLAQTEPRWECVLGDDGSKDHPERVVEHIGDDRIKLIRLDQNMGRGVARQVALEAVQGQYLAFLDADDWVYPDKLAKQLAFMEANPSVCLFSMSMAVVDFTGHIAGIRRLAPPGSGVTISEPLPAPRPLPVAFAPSMIRMEAAKSARFDPYLRLAQDTDFLIQILLGQRFALTDESSYVYTELSSRTPNKVMRAYKYSQHIFRKYLDSHPMASRREIAKYKAKHALLYTLDKVGMGQRFSVRPMPRPQYHELDAFHSARAAVQDQMARLGWASNNTHGAQR